MNTSLLTGTNPVLAREVRVALRNARTFMLLALYVAILGAIVVSEFPSDRAIRIDLGGPAQGRDLFTLFCWAQALLVVLLFPSLATGALAQERERRTLEPLLLTPLTPMQIVWGKAAGVLSLALLLLGSTLPLTSLCFLLGGVAPGELIAAYAMLLGLALLTTGVGLFCSARWSNTTQATLACYASLPFLLAIAFLFAIPGALVSGLFLISAAFYGVFLLWKRWEQGPVARSLGKVWWALLVVVMIAMFFGLLRLMVISKSWSAVIVGIFFATSYLIFLAQLGLQQAAREVVHNLAPPKPLRERLHDFKEEWQQTTSPPSTVYLPAPTGQYTYTPQAAPAPPKPMPVTYGVQPFLSDKLNPIFAKDMRSGLLGRADYLFRFSYVVVILTEILLPCLLLSDVASSSAGWFSAWAVLHLALLMTAGAWFGSRALAPEREQQTLGQLLTTPLRPSTIVQGKMMAVMVNTFYVFVLGLPLALLLASLHEISWRAAFSFMALEFVFGAFAAAWGIFCSLHCVTVRRALGYALGGVLVIMLAGPLFGGLLFSATTYFGPQWTQLLRFGSTSLLPLAVMSEALAPQNLQIALLNAGSNSTHIAPLWKLMAPLGLFSAGALLLLVLTQRGFKRYAAMV